jgi:integrase
MRRRSSQRGAIDCRAGHWSLRMRLQVRVGNRWKTHVRRYPIGTTKTIKTKPAARLEADRMLASMGMGLNTGRSIAFDDFAKLYLRTQVAALASTTISSYRSTIARHLVPHFGDTLLGDITGAAPGGLVAALLKKGLNRQTIASAMGIVARMIDCAAEMGYGVTPINRRTFKLPPAPPRREERAFTVEESQRILAAAPYPWRALYALMAYAGLRCSEALAIEWRDVGLERNVIRIRQAAAFGKIKAVKSANSAAELPIGPTLARTLEELRAHRGGVCVGLLFPSPRGGPYWSSGVRRDHLAPLLKQLGIPPAGLHAFRHGHATNLFAAGIPANVVRTMLRHGDIKTTLRYSHVNSEDMRRAAAAADQLLGGQSCA